MLTLLLRISIPEFRRHLLRTLLTTIGILLGVAIFAAIRSANFSLRASLRDTIDRIAGKAVLQVTGPAGVPETVVDEVRLVPGVRAAVPVIEAVVRTSDLSEGNILMLGVDMTGDKSMRDYTIEGSEDSVSDPLVFLAQPDSIIVSKEFASRNNLRDGSPIKLITALGTRSFTVRGVMAPKGMAKAFGGNVGVMDILSAQFIFSRGRTFDRIDVALDRAAEGVDEGGRDPAGGEHGLADETRLPVDPHAIDRRRQLILRIEDAEIVDLLNLGRRRLTSEHGREGDAERDVLGLRCTPGEYDRERHEDCPA